MTQAMEFARWATRLRALPLIVLAMMFAGCEAADELTSTGPTAVEPEDGATLDDPSFSSRFRGGIPIGYFNLPTSQFGSESNGAVRNIWPKFLVKELAAIKARGGKVVLMFAGHERHYKSGRYFSLAKWKARVDRFRNVNFSSYIKDGTIIAHYLIDEPNDAHNWGRPVPGSTLEEMAKYSKKLWPSLPTVVRAEASYLAKWSGRYRYLDAAWAQYVTRKGTPREFIRRNIADAQRKGLALITGLNVSKGAKNQSRMSPSLIRSAGAELLSSSYPCAFISWQYEGRYVSGSSVRDAMRYLRSRAQSRSTKSCRGPSGGGGGGGDDDDDDDDGGGRDDDD
jgi:hypothetical protein